MSISDSKKCSKMQEHQLPGVSKKLYLGKGFHMSCTFKDIFAIFVYIFLLYLWLSDQILKCKKPPLIYLHVYWRFTFYETVKQRPVWKPWS